MLDACIGFRSCNLISCGSSIGLIQASTKSLITALTVLSLLLVSNDLEKHSQTMAQDFVPDIQSSPGTGSLRPTGSGMQTARSLKI